VNGDVCGPDGADSDFCVSGYCMSSDWTRTEEAQCGTLGPAGNGCDTDADCPQRGDEGLQATVCVAGDVEGARGQCKIVTGDLCTIFDESAYGADNDFCVSGYCMDSEWTRTAPECGTLGPAGNGCDTDADCPQRAR
jgi:hypothetical protein